MSSETAIAALTERLGRLPAVGLAELEATATLLTRRDRKYVVPVSSATQLAEQLGAGCRALEIDGRRRFHYESVYFDTPQGASYLAAARRRSRRYKVRTRSYLDSGRCMLEVKVRDPRGRTVKERREHPIEIRGSLDPGSRAFAGACPLIGDQSTVLEPALATRYTRATLLVGSDRARVTIDTDVAAFAPDGRTGAVPPHTGRVGRHRRTHVDLVREILASHESGISRDGLLAWARLRGDPQMTDAELEAALSALGDQVVDAQGFLYLRENAPASALGAETPASGLGPGVPAAAVGAEASTPPEPLHGSWSSPAEPGRGGPPGWIPPDGAGPTTPSDGQPWPAPDGRQWSPPDGAAWPPPSTGGTRTMIVAAVGVLILLGIAGLVVVVLRAGDTGPVQAEPTPTAGVVVEAGGLQVGDCIILPTEDQFDEVRRLDCTAPHDGEIFFVGDHPDGDYPTDEAFEAFVDEQCMPAFEAFTGSAYDDQEVLDIGWFTPTDGSWENGDRAVSCHLVPIDGGQTDQSWRDANP